MFGISGLAILLAIITIALMGGFSSSRGRWHRPFLRNKDIFVNSITSGVLLRDEVKRYEKDKTPMVLDVKIAGRSAVARRKRIADLSAGDTLYVAWSGRESRSKGWEYTLSIIDCFKNVYATVRDEDKLELANRYDFVQGAVVESVDKDSPRLVVKVIFE